VSLIPFGVERWSMAAIEQQGNRAAAAFPLAVTRPGEILRLSGDTLDLPPPGVSEADWPLVRRVTAHLHRLSGPWNKQGMHFINAYVAALEQQIAAHRDALEAKVARFATLFRPEDFLFSAPVPLPRAFLPTGAGASEADFVPVDVAFWLGDGAQAHILLPNALTPKAARLREQRLADAGIRVVQHTASDLAAAGPGWLDRLLGPASRFWEGVALPAAPGPAPLIDL
jgi:hypothetical protein